MSWRIPGELVDLKLETVLLILTVLGLLVEKEWNYLKIKGLTVKCINFRSTKCGWSVLTAELKSIHKGRTYVWAFPDVLMINE